MCVCVCVREREREREYRLSQHSLCVETQTELESQRAPTVFSLHRGTHRGRAALSLQSAANINTSEMPILNK